MKVFILIKKINENKNKKEFSKEQQQPLSITKIKNIIKKLKNKMVNNKLEKEKQKNIN